MRDYENILVERPGEGVLLVTLDRPDKFNALTFTMFDEIAALCRALKAIRMCGWWF